MYPEIKKELVSLLEGENNFIANASNFAALIWQRLPQLNWVGFYLLDADELLLGPFQGKPACIRISMGKGVCGTSALNRETIVVHDVHQFQGHIACDSASNSEIVVPIIQNDVLYGVLDIDSPVIGRFTDIDRLEIENLLQILITSCNMEELKKYYR
jgi:GAF domain-containing protein